jgi:hypothetical protein
MSPELLRRLGVLGSMALYGVACALPAVAMAPHPPESRSIFGYECLILGLYGIIVGGAPFVAWLMNPFVLTLWILRFGRLPTNRNISWIAGCLAVGAVLILLPWARPLPGAYLWVASIALAGMSCTPQEPSPGRRDFLRRFRKPRSPE